MKRKIDADSCRFLSTRKSTTGCEFRRDSSHHSIATRQTPEMIERRTMVLSANQSNRVPSSRTYCRHPRPTVKRTIPYTSMPSAFRRIHGGSCRKLDTRNIDAAAIGMLMKKIQFQL